MRHYSVPLFDRQCVWSEDSSKQRFQALAVMRWAMSNKETESLLSSVSQEKTWGFSNLKPVASLLQRPSDSWQYCNAFWFYSLLFDKCCTGKGRFQDGAELMGMSQLESLCSVRRPKAHHDRPRPGALPHSHEPPVTLQTHANRDKENKGMQVLNKLKDNDMLETAQSVSWAPGARHEHQTNI